MPIAYDELGEIVTDAHGCPAWRRVKSCMADAGVGPDAASEGGSIDATSEAASTDAAMDVE
jgi:hypothetical protein